MPRTLYICYFGVREPLVQTQVIPYLRELQKDGHEISLLTFEPSVGDGEKARRGEEETKKELVDQGIDWHWLRYHKRPSSLATAYDVFRGAVFIRRMIARENIDLLHGRVHIPTLMGAIARKFTRGKPKLLFDIRGFFPEEYTDAGIWPEGGLLYRTAKHVERWLLKESDGFVVLTEKAREILFPDSKEIGNDRLGRPVEVIPCCVDLTRFETANAETRTLMRDRLGINERQVIAYVGAFGGWYLTDETADFYGVFKSNYPNAFALILTQSKPEMIEPLLRARGYDDGDYLITRVPPGEIPRYLSAADAGVSFIKRCYSKKASSPTKNAEYLACGLPIVANAGVGDVDGLINDNGVGSIVENFDTQSYVAALDGIEQLGNVSDQCRQVARREFDLAEVGGNRYRRIYTRLLGQ